MRCPAPRDSVATVFLLLTLALGNRPSEVLAGDNPEATTPAKVNFQQQIAPLLSERCLACHNSAKAKGGLDLSTPEAALRGGENGPVIVPSRPAESRLLDMVTPGDDGSPPEMPAKGNPLSAQQVTLLRSWIAAGASWPKKLVLRESARADRSWWSLQPLVDTKPPSDGRIPTLWAQHPIDRFIYSKLAEQGLQPNPEADRRTLIRRATYDLLGLPPSPEEVDAFVNDSRPDAYAQLIDRLLASPHYGEQWGRHWMDVIRFGESRGYERNETVDNAWPFRDYVIRSFNDDKPFDRFILEHLAGDVIGKDQPEVEIGTGYLVCGPADSVNNQDPIQLAQIKSNAIDEIIRNTSEAFLGLTIGCAKCHDHKFDPIRREDYYSLYGTFAGVRHKSRDIATREDRQRHDEQLASLKRERELLRKEKETLERTILERAEAHYAQFARQWRRKPPSYSLIEEPFEPVDARYVRLLTDSVNRNPYSQVDYSIDEFEVFSADDPPRNVALASGGAKAEGEAHTAEDFGAQSYSAPLTIDGKYEIVWKAIGPELKITLPRVEKICRVVFSANRNADYKRFFPSEYRIQVSLDGQKWTTVASSYDRKPINAAHKNKRLLRTEATDSEQAALTQLRQSLDRINFEIEAVPALASWWAGEFESVEGPFHVLLGGDPQKKGPEVKLTSLAVLDDLGAKYQLDDASTEGERRLALARWIVASQNPLPPRVLVNRLWHYHFGTGLVDTPSDFGYLGSKPTHPELLDWLTRRMLDHGWKLKPLHREIMLSQSYRQSSAMSGPAAQVDASARYLWRFPSRRLTAEEMRDTFLILAGKLDTRMGGPGFRLYHYIRDNVATYIPLDEHGPETYRRAVYHQNARAARTDLFSEFDCPDSAFAAPARASTTTPLQSLTLLNHRFTIDMARFLAERLEREAGADPPAQIRRAFRLLSGRTPSAEEEAASLELLGRYGLPAFCRALLNSNELVYLD